jgi:SAM-dependent methyltransferase
MRKFPPLGVRLRGLKRRIVARLPPPLRVRLVRAKSILTGRPLPGPAPPPLEPVAKLWGDIAVRRVEQPIQGWLDSSLVLEQWVQPRQSGNPRVNWLDGVIDRVGIPRGGRWLSLGCGAAGHEILLAKTGVCGSILALDAAPAALEQARKDAAAQGVSNIAFGTVDLNAPDLPAGAFDVVLMVMSLHHVRALRQVLGGIHRALRPDGWFILNEYVGPRQFQFPDHQLAIVRDLLAVLPERWRQDSATGQVKAEYVRRPPEIWDAIDPSEAIRSDRIVREVARRFRVVDRLDYGGSVLHLLLEHIVHNFDSHDEKDVAVIRLLGQVEDVLVRHGVLASDFTVMAMQRRPEGIRRWLEWIAGAARPRRSRS